MSIAVRPELEGVWCYAGGMKKNGKLRRYDAVRDDMFWLLASEESRYGCDAVITVAGTDFEVHRAALETRSPWFAKLFLDEPDATYFTFPTPEIAAALPGDVTLHIFRMVLCYAYCGVLGVRRANTPEEQAMVSALADTLGMPLFTQAYSSYSILETPSTRAVEKAWRADVQRMFSSTERSDVVLCVSDPSLFPHASVHGCPSPRSLRRQEEKALPFDIAAIWKSRSQEAAAKERCIFANKVLLAARSRHFAEMFTPGKWRDEGVVLIDHNIISFGTMRGVLEFLATGDVAFLTTDDSMLWTRIFSAVEGARYFTLEPMFLQIEAFVARLIDIDTVCPLWNTCADMKAEHVVERCKAFVIKNFDSVSRSPYFLELQKEHLKTALLTGEIRAPMDDIVKAVLRWGRNRCPNGGSCDESVRRAVFDLLPPSTFFNSETRRLVLGIPPVLCFMQSTAYPVQA